MKRVAWDLLLVAVLVGGLAGVWANRAPGAAADPSAPLPPAPAIGHPAPAFTLTTLDGKELQSGALRGKPVILNFWATWCPPCRGEMADLQRAAGEYAGQVTVIAMDQAEPAAVVKAYVAQQGLSFAIPLDTAGAVSSAYGVRSLPTTYFIDRGGIIRQIQVGPLTGPTLTQLLQAVYP